jgi:hypothetical protein
VTVPHEAVAAVQKLQALHRGEKRLGFHLHSLRKQLPRTSSQDIRQWIVDFVGLTRCYARSWRIALLERFWQARHPPRYAAYLIPSSPIFPHSSTDGEWTAEAIEGRRWVRSLVLACAKKGAVP